MTQPCISVIIPTFNRAASLTRLLGSIEAVEKPEDYSVEVLVVDNGSTDETENLLETEREKPRRFSLRALRERQRGKANALNAGLAAAQGTIMIVIDDDVTVDPLCLVKHVECHLTTDFDAVQGRIMPGLDPDGNPADPQRLLEYNIPVTEHGESACEVAGLTGTNMSFKRGVFENVGYFDGRLGPGASGFSEDTEYSIRIRNAGYKIGYAPQAIVYHELSPARYGRAYNRAVEYRKGMSRSLYRRESVLFRVIPKLIARCVAYVVYRALGKAQKAYKTEGRIMKCCGYLVGRLRKAGVRR